MPSYLGSKVQPSPSGTEVPMLAYIGSRRPTARDRGGAADALRVLGGAGRLAVGDFLTFAGRFPAAISSMVRPVVTDVVVSATMSMSSRASSSRCLIKSHCGLEDPVSRPRMRTSTHDPLSRSPCSVNLRSPLRYPRRIALSSSPSSAVSARYVPRSHNITVPPPYSPLGI